MIFPKPRLMLNFLEIDEDSKVPKYKQVVDTIVSDIESEVFKIGDRIPSINETSEEFYLSRDTVEKAYKILRERGIISSVRGKGFYVASTGVLSSKRILLVFNKLSDHKKEIYNGFVNHLGDRATVDLQIHHSDATALENIIIENLGNYDYYVIMPHLRTVTKSVMEAIKKIPKDKLILINKQLSGMEDDYASVYEDFESDISGALMAGQELLKKYSKLRLVFPIRNFYCSGIKTGFLDFCAEAGYDFDIIDSLDNQDVVPGEVYILIEEFDLVELIKRCNAKKLKIGKEVGIICYNDSPFKEILAGGITAISTDFRKMGETAAKMIVTKKREKIKNPFSMTIRKSL